VHIWRPAGHASNELALVEARIEMIQLTWGRPDPTYRQTFSPDGSAAGEELPETGPDRALAATTAIATLCVIGDVTMITMFAVSAAPERPLAVIAVAASLTRIACSIIVIRTATQMRRRSQAP
jgi:hypothetical protein